MNSGVEPIGLVLGGKSSPDALDLVRRYCGLPWSGGTSETWAFRYFDVIATAHDHLDPVDVVSAASLHPGVGRSDLAFFHDLCADIDAWLADVPLDVSLSETDDLGALLGLVDFAAPSFTLLTKVLHRKRPQLVPIADRHVVDRYRAITGERQAIRAWPMLLEALRADLRRNEQPIDSIVRTIAVGLGHQMSALRICDVVIWMDGRS